MSANKQQFLRTTSSERFEAFLQILSAQLGQSAVLPDGIGDVEADSGTASYAISRGQVFGAARWLQSDGERGLVQVDASFVSPSRRAPVATLTLRTIAGSSLPDAPAWLDDWVRAIEGTSETVLRPLPGFTELSAMLASLGNVATSSAQVAARVGTLEDEVEYLQLLLTEQLDETRHLKAQLRSSQYSKQRTFADLLASASTAHDAPDEDDFDLSSLATWVAARTDEIVILPRALNGAKKSIYESPETIYRALDFLAKPYRQARLGQLSHTQMQEALDKHNIGLSGSVGVSVAGSFGDDYFVQYNGRRRLLDMHLVKGGGRDDRYCMRIYFFYDEESGRAVVGSMPAHLDNSLK